MTSKGNYINGIWRHATGSSLISRSPNNDEVIWTGQNSTVEDVDECVNYATQALVP